LLRAFGFDDAAVLDGGWTTWVAEGRSTSIETTAHPAATFKPRPRPGLFVNKEDIYRAMEDPGTVIVSALGRRSHRGEIAEYGRAGRIPGAQNVSAFALIDKHTQKFLPEPVLRERFAGILDAPRIITYCGGAVAACSDAFILRLLGHRNVAVYDGSLIEWNSDPTTPIEVG
jgi:thiosulfate/3-mercaptopyruvate sulfurtransferase